MKKWLSIFLAMLMLLTCTAAGAEESEWMIDTDLNKLMGYSGTGGDVVVPETIDGCPVEVISVTPFSGNKAVTGVIISEGCLAIADRAFSWCEKLAKVELPQTLQVIGEQAFQRCALTQITIPAAVGFIDDKAFGNCENLAAITFEGEVPHFGGSEAFSNIAGNAVFHVPDDRIDAYAATLPEGVNVQPSGKNVMTVSYLADEADLDFDASTGAITACSSRAPIIEIPAQIGGIAVTTIGDSAFYWNETLYRIDIPEGVTAIENQAFDVPSVLVEVNLPSTLKTIGDSALANFYGEKLVLPTGLERIGASAFADSYLTELFIGAGLKELDENALEGCDDLAGITLDAAASDELLQMVQAHVDALGLQCTVSRLVSEEPAAPAANADASAYLGDWYLTMMEYDGIQVNPASMGMLMTLTLNEDGSAVMFAEGEEPNEMAWTLDADGLKIGAEGEWMPLQTLEDGTLSLEEDGVVMAFGREAPEAPENDWASSPIVEATANQLLGVWTMDTLVADGMTLSAADMDMEATLTIGKNVVQMDMMGDVEAMEWKLENGALVAMDELTLCLHENGMLSLDEEDGSAWFIYTGMYDEEPVLSEQHETVTEPEPEAPAAEMDASTFVGDWYLTLMEEDGVQIDPAEFGLIMVLTLNEDGTAALTAEGEEPDQMEWTLDADGLKIGGEGEWLTADLLEDGLLSVEDSGSKMVFGRGASENVGGKIAPSSIAEPSGDYSARMGIQYVMVSAEMSGYTVSPEQMGSLEYALLFRDDGSCDFVIAGTSLPMKWTLGTAETEDGVADAFLIDYYGTPLSAVVTEAGFDMNYMDSMLIHYEAAE